MAQITIDTSNPDDVQLMRNLLDAGLMGHCIVSEELDLDEAVGALLAAVGDEARYLLQEFVYQTAQGPTTLEAVAEGLGVDYQVVKGRKLNLGRSIKKVQKAYPGMPDPMTSKWDAADKCTYYTMDDDVRKAVERWLDENWKEEDAE